MPSTSTNPSSSRIGLYRTGITDPEHRRHITVGRQAMFEDTIEILRRNIGRKPKHHQLFIGPRGIGKTHLLSLTEDEVQRDPTLSAGYHIARFPEESHRTLSFADFLLGLCEILRDTLPDEPQWRDLHSRLATEEQDKIIVDTLVPAIRQRRRNHPTHQALLVMMENINQVFEQQIKDRRSIAALRGFFMEDNGCLLIGTAPLHFGGISDPAAPFFDFFDVQVLDQLSDEEMIGLIRRNLEWDERFDLLADFPSMRPRLLAIYRMTGGSPRLALMLYELIATEDISEVKQQFRILLDRITPYYQDRMSDLGPQEQAVLETIALIRDEPKTPAAIAERMRMKPAQTSALLGRLTKAHYLRSIENPADKRSRLYTIRESLFDIWLAMNVSRGARERLPYLLDFFAGFYRDLESHNRKLAELRKQSGSESSGHVREEPGTSSRDAAESLGYLSTVETVSEHLLQEQLQKKTPTDYLSEVERMITSWEAHRTGNLEVLAQRFHQLSKGRSEAELSATPFHDLLKDIWPK
ncbi:MAG: helix-turn-helix domain-containing protein [Verrucomicrobiales bacterium]